MSFAFVRLPKRHLNLFLFPAILLACGIIVLISRHTSDALFYKTGLFVRYHDYMTNDLGSQDALSKDLVAQGLGYSAVILYLINFNRLRELMLSLRYLHENVAMHPWPIVLFHTEDMQDTTRQKQFILRLYDFMGGGQDARAFVSRIEFVYLHLELPGSISHVKAIADPVFIDQWPGYHLMCGFFATQIFDHPRLSDVTYYMRLDTDSYIFGPLCDANSPSSSPKFKASTSLSNIRADVADPISRFHARNATYGYRSRTTDPDWVTHGLWSLTDSFAARHTAVEFRLRANGWVWPDGRGEVPLKDGNYPTYYNNFEIVKLEAFRRPDVREWLDEVQRDPKNIYKYRWGDAPIRYATVNMFFDVESTVQEYCDIEYWHNGVQGNKCACGGRNG